VVVACYMFFFLFYLFTLFDTCVLRVHGPDAVFFLSIHVKFSFFFGLSFYIYNEKSVRQAYEILSALKET
jgi:hypothetical protein